MAGGLKYTFSGFKHMANKICKYSFLAWYQFIFVDSRTLVHMINTREKDYIPTWPHEDRSHEVSKSQGSLP